MASLWVKNGSLVLCAGGTKLAYQDTCPCEEEEPAPCSCPCTETPWPSGVTWPCSGLVEVYTVENGLISSYDGANIVYRAEYGSGEYGGWGEIRINPSTTVTATYSGNPCYWFIYTETENYIEYRTANNTSWQGTSYGSETTLILTCVSSVGHWYCFSADGATDLGSGLLPALKNTGLTPVGTYYQFADWGGGYTEEAGSVVS